MSGAHQALLMHAGAAAGPVQGWVAGIYKLAISTGAVSVSITLNSDGTITGSHTGAAGTVNDTATGKNWYMPTTPGVGSSHWCRFTTLLSGQTPSAGAALGTWVPVNTAWTYQAPAGAAGTSSSRAGSLRIDIATDAGGANIVASGTMNLEANRDA